MPTRVPPSSARRVVILVISNFLIDNRVQKTATSVGELGYDVTVVWAHPSVRKVTTVDHGSYSAVAIPLPYTQMKAFDERMASPHGNFKLPVLNRKGHLQLVRKTARWVAIRANRLSNRLHAKKHPTPTELRSRHQAMLADISESLVKTATDLKPAIVHVQDIQALEAGATVCDAFGEQERPALIYDAHEYVAGQVILGSRAPLLWEETQRAHIGKVDAVSTVSEPIAELLQRDYKLQAKPTVVLNAPRLAEVASNRSIRTDCGLAAETPLVIYSGSVAPQRGIATVVQAMSKIPQAHLAVICVPNTRSQYAKELETLAASLEMSDRLHLLDPVGPDDVVGYIASADVGIHPLTKGPLNHDLALPNKLFDYIHAQLTIVVSDVQTMARFVTEHNLGNVFVSGDPGTCRTAIETAISNTIHDAPVQSAELTQYTWATQADRLAEMYESL